MGGLQQQRPAAGPRQQRLQKKPIQTVKRFSPSKHYLATTLQTSQMATGIINKIIRSFWGFKSSKAPIRLSEELLPDLFGFSCEYLNGWAMKVNWQQALALSSNFSGLRLLQDHLEVPNQILVSSSASFSAFNRFIGFRWLSFSCLCMWLLELGQCEKLSDTTCRRMGFEGQAFCKLLWNEWWWGTFKLHQRCTKVASGYAYTQTLHHSTYDLYLFLWNNTKLLRNSAVQVSRVRTDLIVLSCSIH